MMERIERTGVELRAEGRNLSGVVMPYGTVAPTFKEKFLPGSLLVQSVVPLNLAHKDLAVVAFTGGGKLELRDTPEALLMECEVPETPPGDMALDMLQQGQITGLSVEFRSVQETKEGDLRVIERATLLGIGLVRTPAYPQSKVEVRSAQWNLLLLGGVG